MPHCTGSSCRCAVRCSAEDALAQIKESGYAAPYMASDKKIVLIGAGFDEQARTLKDWTTTVPHKA
ncbi:MAG: PD-(D/E)XK nuclease domain-containing protein [Candidatus Fimenecus sp.]